MKPIHVVLAVEVLALAVIIYRARVPDPAPSFPNIKTGGIGPGRFVIRRGSSRSVSPGTIGAAEFRTDGGPTLY